MTYTYIHKMYYENQLFCKYKNRFVYKFQVYRIDYFFCDENTIQLQNIC